MPLATTLELESVTVCGSGNVINLDPAVVNGPLAILWASRCSPTPDSGDRLRGVMDASSDHDDFPRSVSPVCEGVKITPKVQVPLAATCVPLQVSSVTVKSPEGATLVTLSATLLGLVKVMVFAAAGNLHRLLAKAQASGRIGRLYENAFARQTYRLRTVGSRVGERQRSGPSSGLARSKHRRRPRTSRWARD